MAAGKRPFDGKSQISLASSILEKDPEPVSAINPLVPAAFEHVLATCLQKNPDERFQTAHDIKLQLQWIASDRSSAARAVLHRSPARNRERFAWAGAVVAAIVIGAFTGAFLYRPTPSLRTIRTVMNAPQKSTLNLMGDFAGPPVLSPDGASIAFAATDSDGKSALWIRPMNSPDAHILPGTEGAIFPFWSSDNRSLGFFADSKLKTIDINGSSAQEIADAPFGRGGAWGAGGVILFSGATQTPIMRINASGGAPIPVTKIDRSLHTSHRWPFFLPDGKHFLYLAIHHDPSKATNDTVYYASLDASENRPLFRSQSNAIYAAGFILFARGDQLMAQHFDPTTGALTGTPVSIAKGVANDISTWHVDASASDDGLLILGNGGSADWQLIWADRHGNQVGTIADKLTNLQLARISPQGDRIALQIDNGQADIWVLDMARGVRTRLTFGPVINQFPVWSPDGKWIVYNSGRNGRSEIYRKPSDGSGAEELLLSDEQPLVPNDWSRDGKQLIYSRCSSGGHCEMWVLPLEGDRKPRLVVSQAAISLTTNGHLSPDGRWLAYASDESGAPEVYVVAFGGGQGKWQVSANGGSQPQWSKDGKELYYMDPTFNLLAVPVTNVGSALQFGAAQKLVNSTSWSSPVVFYDVAPDSKKILMNRVSQQVNQSVTVVTNFTAELGK
jgi:Tol biopolymer transport system component